MPNTEDKVNELKLEFVQFKSELKAAVTLTRYLLGAITTIVFIFFGISYAKLDGIVQKSVEALIENETITQATSSATAASEKSIALSEEASRAAQQSATAANAEFVKAQDEMQNAINSFHETVSKLHRYEEQAQGHVLNIEVELEGIKSKIPNLSQLSQGGIAKNGEIIKAPSGSVADWTLIISPRYIGHGLDGIGENTLLLSADYSVEPESPDSWKITAYSRHKFGQTTTSIDSEVNYVLIPTGR